MEEENYFFLDQKLKRFAFYIAFAFNFCLVVITCLFGQCSSTAAEIAQLGERQTEDLKVPGSNPVNSYEF